MLLHQGRSWWGFSPFLHFQPLSPAQSPPPSPPFSSQTSTSICPCPSLFFSPPRHPSPPRFQLPAPSRLSLVLSQHGNIGSHVSLAKEVHLHCPLLRCSCFIPYLPLAPWQQLPVRCPATSSLSLPLPLTPLLFNGGIWEAGLCSKDQKADPQGPYWTKGGCKHTNRRGGSLQVPSSLMQNHP